MITHDEIDRFCARHDYDIRKSHNGRWIDQKCTSDVVSFIADCVQLFTEQRPDVLFSVKDIWLDEETGKNVNLIFKKPGVAEDTAKSEYDKFFAQLLKLLANAGVLKETKQGVRNRYSVADRDVLEYIALREKNALYFLYVYISKVLKDSDIMDAFQVFFSRQNKESYDLVRGVFFDFTHQNTPITGTYEPGRIFTKAINILAYYRNACGTRSGRMSKTRITYDELMYNRLNFRDIYADKPKELSRQEYAATLKDKPNANYYKYQSAKAKRFLRRYNDIYRGGKTEHEEDRHMADHATEMHHIFPEAQFPTICGYLENIIALTPTQHMNYAHPDRNTGKVDEQYRYLLLLSKADRIRENLSFPDPKRHIYDYANYLIVLSVGFEDEAILDTAEMDFDEIVHQINLHCG